MAFLVLDLDETVMYISEHTQYVHAVHQSYESHSFSNPRFDGVTDTVNLHIINPLELSELITQAFTQHSGVMILTSGLWSRTILSFIADKLPLEPEIKEKFINSSFYSAIEELHYWSKPNFLQKVRHIIDQQLNMGEEEAVFWRATDKDDQSLIIEWIRRKLSKNERLNCIIHNSSEAHGSSGHYFLMLDNDLNHIQSFALNPRVKAVHATTAHETNDFYAQAQILLTELERMEYEDQLALSNTSLDSVLMAASDKSFEQSTSGLKTFGLFHAVSNTEDHYLTFDEDLSL